LIVFFLLEQLFVDAKRQATLKMSVNCKVILPSLLLWCWVLQFLLLPTTTFSLNSEAAKLTRSRLAEALSSPSGKLTISPEIFIPEPSTPTAILLQSAAVNQLSSSLRTKAKANAAFLACPPTSLTSLQTFCNEQEEARGNFPGPVPVVYCEPSTSEDGFENDDIPLDFSGMADVGVSGILISVPEIVSVQDMKESDIWVQKCKKALESGLQPIPEVNVQDATASTWNGREMEELVTKISELTGQEPLSIMLTIKSSKTDEGDDSSPGENADDTVVLPLPAVPKALGKRVPIIGSIRIEAGENRLGEETARYKAAGFSGAVLRRECVPNYRLNPSLEYTSDFWAACIGDLKSTRSKTFNFRSRNLMEKSMPTEWAKYQKSVIESGALGDPEDSGPPPGFNPDAGDFKGF
jgi:hypothetical protein